MIYDEFSPRVSSGKLSGRAIQFGPVANVLLAMTYEFGYGEVESYLIGPGFDLKLPGFDFLQFNFYHREPVNHESRGWQLTSAWSVTIPLGESEFVFDGFLDWVFHSNDESEYEPNLHFNPQLKYNLGKALWDEDVQLYIGIEYDY